MWLSLWKTFDFFFVVDFFGGNFPGWSVLDYDVTASDIGTDVQYKDQKLFIRVLTILEYL